MNHPPTPPPPTFTPLDFANYLTDRKQIVKYNVTYSTEKTIKCGVPQGTVLGPLLFLLYINDIHCSSNLSFILFADDTNLFRSGKDLKQLEIEINHELILVQTWLKDNQLTLNIKKTNYIIFKSFRKKLNANLTFKINDKIIQNAKETKFLGIIIDEHLTWKNHIDYITKKLLKVSNILCKVRHYLNKKHLITLYHTLVYPHLYYGNILWASNYKSRLKSVSTIQKKILKIISFLPYTFSSSTLFSTLEILKINKINAFQVGLFTFDAVKNTLQPQFDSRCIKNNVIHCHNTRGSMKLHKHYNKTNYGLYSTKNRCTVVWNMLPEYIVKIAIVNTYLSAI